MPDTFTAQPDSPSSPETSEASAVSTQLDSAGVAHPATPGAAPRRSRNRRQPSKAAPGRRPYSRYLFTAAALGGAAYIVGWHSPLTVVRDLQVVAPKGISAKKVLAAADIDAGSHVPGVSPAGVRMSVMTEIPEIADVQVVRRLPHTIQLIITPRVPHLALSTKSGYLILDSSGVAFQRSRDPGGLPVINADKDPGRATAIEVMAQLPEALAKKVAVVTATTGDDVTLNLGGGATVRWGAATDAQLKAQVLAALLQVKAANYDVSAPLLPTTTEPTVTPSPS
ncbi:MAG: cell division protein FtsQ/DivIB [Candidatus Nanopelagicales bacterium]